MTRRYAGAGQQRREGRLSSAALTPLQLLSPYLVDCWDSEINVGLVSGNVDTWTGMRLGIVLSAAAAGNRPTYGADGAHFNGHSVVQCSATGARFLRILDYGSDLQVLGAGVNPYLLLVGRLRSAPPASDSFGARVFHVAPASTVEVVSMTAKQSDGEDRCFVRDAGPANKTVAGDAFATSVMLREAWSGSGANVRRNMGTTYTTAGTDGTDAASGNIRRIGIGARADNYAGTDESVRFAAYCHSKPPDSTIAAVYQHFRRDSGF